MSPSCLEEEKPYTHQQVMISIMKKASPDNRRCWPEPYLFDDKAQLGPVTVLIR
jgi:hypothetical protein